MAKVGRGRVLAQWFLVACGGACAGTPGPGPQPNVPVAAPAAREPAPAGTIVRLRPTTAAGLDATQSRDLLAIDGWWRAAMRQSTHLDVAAPPDDGQELPGSPWSVQLALDPTARALVATLEVPGRPPLVIASTTFAGRELPDAIDRLALTVRVALGEPAPTTIPVSRCLSPDPLVAAGVERAAEDLDLGDPRQAVRDLQALRRRDGGSPAVLDLLAAARALQGDPTAARALATEALGLTHRLSAPQQHRLLRTVLLARAAQDPDQASACDRELGTLAEVANRERPFDVQVQLTAALAHNLRGEFARALPALQALRARLPGSAAVRYHLAWAQLALGDAVAARQGLAAVAGRLPIATTLQPRAIACFESGAHDELRELLATLAADPDVAAGAAVHEIHRMRAAHALLQGRADEAADLLFADLAWLLQRPSLLNQRAGELAATAEVLVRLGHARRLQTTLDASKPLATDPMVADALAFASGLTQVAIGGERALVVEAALARGGESAWSATLVAFAHHQRGELADEFQALGKAARLSDAPLLKAALVACLRAQGRGAEATRLRDALRAEMRTVSLRQRLPHPILAPERALAWLCE